MSDARKSGGRFSVQHRDQKGLDFWARRKAAVQAEEQDAARLAEAEAQAERDAELAERTDEDILAELELPDPDTLQDGDDFKVFLTDAVPARIRTRALRRLWRLNPVLANVDGLVDYGEDFTDASCVIENLQTAYQVGKGMTEHVLELARKAEAAAAAEDAPEPEEPLLAKTDDADAQPLGLDDAPDADAEEAPEHIPDYDFSDLGPDEDMAPPASRRMRFAFDVPHSGELG